MSTTSTMPTGTIPKAGVSGGRYAVTQGRGYAGAVLSRNQVQTKWIEVSMFKMERTTRLQMNEEEHARLIAGLNIDPRRLHKIDDHEKIKLYLEVDADLDMSMIALHEAITIRRGLRTRPIKTHAHMEFVKVYKTSARDDDSDIIRMLSTFGEVLSCTHQS